MDAPVNRNVLNYGQTELRSRLDRLSQLGHWLDSSIVVPGTKFRIGWDTVIGLLPGVGDLATMAMAAWIINEARRLGVSRFTLVRMLANTGMDTVIGSVPVAGDLFDAAFKSNVRNIALLRDSLEERDLLNERETDDSAPSDFVRVV